jgi:hypothetical protein
MLKSALEKEENETSLKDDSASDDDDDIVDSGVNKTSLAIFAGAIGITSPSKYPIFGNGSPVKFDISGIKDWRPTFGKSSATCASPDVLAAAQRDSSLNEITSSSPYRIFGSGSPVKFDISDSKEVWRPAFGISSATCASPDVLAAAQRDSSAGLTNSRNSSTVSKASSSIFGSKQNQTVCSFSALASLARVCSSSKHGQTTGLSGAVADSTSISGGRSIDIAGKAEESGFDSLSNSTTPLKLGASMTTTRSTNTNNTNEYDDAVKVCTAWKKARRARVSAWMKSMMALNASNVESTGTNPDDISVAASAATVSHCCLYCTISLHHQLSQFLFCLIAMKGEAIKRHHRQR